MRGGKDSQVTMLAFVDLEAWVPPDHPLRTIKALAGPTPPTWYRVGPLLGSVARFLLSGGFGPAL